MWHRLVNAVLYFLSGFTRRDSRKVLFGAWMGHRYADNPKYLMLYLAARDPKLDLVWCGRDQALAQIPADLPVRRVRYGSLPAVREMLSAGHCFVSHGFSDIGRHNLLRGAVLTYLGHGLALKHMGSPDVPLANPLLSALRRLIRHAESFTYCVAVSAVHREKLLKEYAASNITSNRLLDTGQPRVDFLLSAVQTGVAEAIRTEFLRQHDLGTGCRVVAYLPTFRDTKDQPFSFMALTGEARSRIECLLQRENAVLVEKHHFGDEPLIGMEEPAAMTRIIRLNQTRVPFDTQELLLAADLLVTDYSGCYLDFLMLDRPVIHFAYDRDYYEAHDRGLYFSLNTVAAGPIVKTFAELVQWLERDLQEPERASAQRKAIVALLLEYERGHASEQLVEALELAGLVQARPSAVAADVH